MKKWVIGLIIGGVVLLLCCVGVGLFGYKFFQKATATQSAYDQVQIGQDRSQVEDIMGSSGLPSDNTKNPPAGTECRTWINKDGGNDAFEICYANGKVTTKTMYNP